MTKTQDYLLAAGLLIVVFTNLVLQFSGFRYGEFSTALMLALIVALNQFNLKRGKLDEFPGWRRTIVVSIIVCSVFGVLFFAYGVYKLAL